MPDRRQTITLRNELAEIARLAEFVDAFCAPIQPSDQDRLSLHLLLEEAATNVINHGYRDGQPHTFTVSLAFTAEERITAVITDTAPAFDPLARPPVDTSRPLEEREIGGLGVHLLKRLTDYSHYERKDGKNVLTLERVIRRAS